MTPMSRFALLVHLKAAAGREEEVAAFLASAQPLVDSEPGTITWFAGQLDTRNFMIFDTFDDEAGRNAHLNGPVAAALGGIANDLLAGAPDIQKVNLLAEKLP
jgi:quinol monooxygenase YgiN